MGVLAAISQDAILNHKVVGLVGVILDRYALNHTFILWITQPLDAETWDFFVILVVSIWPAKSLHLLVAFQIIQSSAFVYVFTDPYQKCPSEIVI